MYRFQMRRFELDLSNERKKRQGPKELSSYIIKNRNRYRYSDQNQNKI